MRAEAMVTGRVSMDGSRVVAAMAVKMAVEAVSYTHLTLPTRSYV